MQNANIFQQKTDDSTLPCFKSMEQNFGGKPMTSFTDENNKNLSKKWACDDDGVTMSSKWLANHSRVRAFSFGEAWSGGPF